MNDELKNTSKFKAWISAMRLRTLPLSFSVIIVGNTLAFTLYGSNGCIGPTAPFRWDILSMTLLTTLLLQILSNFANDYGDSKKGADNDGRIGPSRAVQSGLISSKGMLIGIIITAGLSLISGIYLLSISFEYFDLEFFKFLGLGLFCILGAIGYTVGRKAYGYYGLGDLFVFIFFGLIGVCGSFYLHHKEIYFLPIIFGVMMGALSTVVLNLNNMRDRENDEKVGKRTLAVRLGFNGSKIYHYILFILFWGPLGYLFIPEISSEWKYAIWFLPVLVIHSIHIIKVSKIQEPKNFDPMLKVVALSSFLFSLIFFFTVYFS